MSSKQIIIKAKRSYLSTVEVLPLGVHRATGVKVGIFLPSCHLSTDYRGEHLEWIIGFRQLTGEVLENLPTLESYTASEDGHTILFALEDSFELEPFFTSNRNANLWKLCELLRTIRLLTTTADFYRKGGAGFTKKLGEFSKSLEDPTQVDKILYETLPSCFRELEKLAKEYLPCHS